MRIFAFSLALALLPGPGWAETAVALRTIRAHGLVTAADVKLVEGFIPGTVSQLDQLHGKEARRIIYAGRPIRESDIGPAALVERNDLIKIGYRQGSMLIQTDGRALGRGGAGDRIQVQNLSSRARLLGTIDEKGDVWISP